MHSKEKGNIGEMAIAKDLMVKGYHVFTELGDISKIDLIAEKQGKLLRVQVKCLAAKDSKVKVDRRKSGPNYKYQYTEEDFDWLAVYVYNKDIILYIPVKELSSVNHQITVRIDSSKNNQTKGVRVAEEYLELECSTN